SIIDTDDLEGDAPGVLVNGLQAVAQQLPGVIAADDDGKVQHWFNLHFTTRRIAVGSSVKSGAPPRRYGSPRHETTPPPLPPPPRLVVPPRELIRRDGLSLHPSREGVQTLRERYRRLEPETRTDFRQISQSMPNVTQPVPAGNHRTHPAPKVLIQQKCNLFDS